MTDIDLTGIKVGDTVYIVSSDQRETPHEAVVTIVGRKYITVDNGYYSKFSKEDGFCTEWSQWRLYPSKRAYEVECEKKDMLRYITRNIERANLCYHDLKTIYHTVKYALDVR